MVILWLKLKSSTFFYLFFYLIQQFILINAYFNEFGGVKGVFHFVRDVFEIIGNLFY